MNRLRRWLHREFWPAWLFYLPLIPWLAYLSLRYRGMLVWTAANPGMENHGIVGESKYAILAQLPASWVIPSGWLGPDELPKRLAKFRDLVELRDWSFPLILKPDAAQRGSGVRRIADLAQARAYLAAHPDPTLVQPYHPGPYELGIFYYRLPGESRGRIFSITDKVFPVLVGDGRRSLRELITQHPRYSLQAEVFLQRHAARRDQVLTRGQHFFLALAGNHCQGTLFCDGQSWWTPMLEARIDAIAREHPGFFIGRFDVRFHDPEALRQGRAFAIVELNATSSESTNIYDPAKSLWWAYRVLFRQWRLLYQIGAANRRLGHRPVTVWAMARLLRRYYKQRTVDPLSD